jgi:zinc and cadmium transporter
MPILGYVLLATLSVSFLSLAGLILIWVRDEPLGKFLEYLVGIAVGCLLGGAFLHLLPESLESKTPSVYIYVLAGIMAFFLIEKLLCWRHCHLGRCDAHNFTYLSLIGDGVHNFVDGTLIAASFVTDIRLGLATTVAVAVHEIPQEIGDFAILVYGGFSKTKALVYNLLSALAAVAGGVVAYYAFAQISWLKEFLVPFTAGGFIYIALVDMVPELHGKAKGRKIVAQTVSVIAGLCIMWWLKILLEH